MTLKSSRNIYKLKRDTIKNCIFACDVEASATDIAKLRLWLSLVIDNQIADEDNDELGYSTYPRELPNLDCNIICGNSLIDEFYGIPLITESSALNNLSKNSQASFLDERMATMIDELIELQSRLYDEKEHVAKEALKGQIQDIYNEIIIEQLSTNVKAVDAYHQALRQPSQPFILWQLYFPKVFRDNGGFDVVIGNPPYISTKGVSTEDKRQYERVFGFSDDTYNLFTFKGLMLANAGGTLNYIIPKTFWTTQTKRNMRDLILSKTIRYVFDTANPFESAMVDTCIIQVANSEPSSSHIVLFLDGSKDLSNPVEMHIEQNAFINTQNSVIFKPTEFNMRMHELYGAKVKELYDRWWDKIKTSRDIEKNREELETYRQSLKPGDVALLGCLTEGGQGLATANNGKYIAVRSSTKQACLLYTSDAADEL